VAEVMNVIGRVKDRNCLMVDVRRHRRDAGKGAQAAGSQAPTCRPAPSCRAFRTALERIENHQSGSSRYQFDTAIGRNLER
jgi:hypothetical protein